MTRRRHLFAGHRPVGEDCFSILLAGDIVCLSTSRPLQSYAPKSLFGYIDQTIVCDFVHITKRQQEFLRLNEILHEPDYGDQACKRNLLEEAASTKRGLKKRGEEANQKEGISTSRIKSTFRNKNKSQFHADLLTHVPPSPSFFPWSSMTRK